MSVHQAPRAGAAEIKAPTYEIGQRHRDLLEQLDRTRENQDEPAELARKPPDDER
jgi:hypothetical protein